MTKAPATGGDAIADLHCAIGVGRPDIAAQADDLSGFDDHPGAAIMRSKHGLGHGAHDRQNLRRIDTAGGHAQ